MNLWIWTANPRSPVDRGRKTWENKGKSRRRTEDGHGIHLSRMRKDLADPGGVRGIFLCLLRNADQIAGKARSGRRGSGVPGGKK